MPRLRLAVLAAALLALAACEPSSAGAAANGSRDGVAGTGYLLRVRGTRECAPTALYPAPRSRRWVGVELELEATGAHAVPASFYYARVVDSAGRSYESAPGPCAPPLRHAPLTRGARALGWASFAIDTQATGLELRFAPRLPVAPSEELRLALGS
ncbi:MAG: hypothetical protein OZ921_16030 [Sorangiineae bacterium]|nr:hypothetical protein [Polyangiaceae bacterium]MEB2324021.1 hypothetical protein [Sorangiineae bacterium]